MRYFIAILLFVVSVDCSDKREIDLNLSSKLFANKDTQNCIVSYFNFDCSSCVGAMDRIDDVLDGYSNVYYVVSSVDSIRAFFYLEKIDTKATVIFDKNLEFIGSNRHIDFSRNYPVFVVKDGLLIYHKDPFMNYFGEMSLKCKIKCFAR